MVTRVCPIWMVKITIKSLKSKNGFKCPFRRWVSPFYPLRSLKILKSQSHIVNFSPTDLIFFVRVSGTHILLRRRKKDMLSGQKDRIHSVLKTFTALWGWTDPIAGPLIGECHTIAWSWKVYCSPGLETDSNPAIRVRQLLSIRADSVSVLQNTKKIQTTYASMHRT